MKRLLVSIVTALVAVIMITSTVFAGKISLGGALQTSLGSFIAKGTFVGVGSTDWLVELQTSGVASVICTNNGSNDVPGQSYPHVDGSGSEALPYDPSNLVKNGKSPFNVTAKPTWDEKNPYLSWSEGGCPNENWSARYDFVYWDKAIILVKDPVSKQVVATFKFVCTTTRIPQNDVYTFDDGTVSCSQVK